MIYLVIFVILVVLIGPGIWVQLTIRKHARELPTLPGTGAEFAQHLLQRFGLHDVKVERTQPHQDHYSPTEKIIRLSPDIYNGRSISAVAIAAHEFGHALQYHRGETITRLREKCTPLALTIERISIYFIGFSPILIALFKVPQLGLLSILAALLALLISVILQLIVLPMEWDASFHKAYPIIEQGNYLEPQHLPIVKKILRAAAMTYVAATLSSLLSVWRWLAILKGFR